MLPVAKHGDPQLGIDIHLCIVPPGVPTPLPTPHSSIVFDPMDYVPFLGATVTCCGMKRATAGTAGSVIHIPPGFPFAPLLPESDDELFMGSATVVADGEPLSHSAHPVLGCQVAGMLSPPRKKKKNTNFRNLPTTFNLAIPTNVFVGGPPMISMMGLASKIGFAALGKFAKSSVFKKFRRGVADKLGLKKPGFLRCKVLRAEPVSILNGSVSVEQLDFSIPGRIFILWPRSYRSDSFTSGVCGTGWETLIDTRITRHQADGTVWVISPSFGLMVFEQFPIAIGAAVAELELMDGSRMADLGQEIHISAPDQLIYCFPKDRYYLDESGQHCWKIGRIMDRSGNALDFECRDEKIIAIHESAGRTLTLTYEKDRLSGVILRYAEADFEQRLVSYDYDDAGQLTTVNDALGVPYHFAYDQDRLVRHTDRNGLSFYYQYGQAVSGEWRVIHAWGDGGLYDYRFAYLDTLNERRITDSLGHVTTIKLNEEGLPISELDPLGGMTLFEYDEAGRTTAVTDPGGRRTDYLFDDRGNMIKLTRPDGKYTQTTFDPGNQPILMRDPDGNPWRQEWDERNLLVKQISPMGHSLNYVYDQRGQLILFQNAKGMETAITYDALGNPDTITNALGQRTTFKFSPLGNLLSKRDPLNQETKYFYDDKCRLLQISSPIGATVCYEYDSEDNVTSFNDQKGQTTRCEYFGQGQIAKIIQADGSIVSYQYDTEENLISIKNQKGEFHQIHLDALGMVREEIDFWGQSRRYEYDKSGYLVSTQNAMHQTIQYETNELGWIKAKVYPDGKRDNFSYNDNGQLIYADNLYIKILKIHDSDGRLTSENQGDLVIESEYDPSGNRTARSTSLGNKILFAYDELDQVISIRINNAPDIIIKRDACGKIIKEQLTKDLLRCFTYDANGSITELSAVVNEAIAWRTVYEYDKSDNLTRRIDSHCGTDIFSYDPIGQIVNHIDPTGRITHRALEPTGDRLMTEAIVSQKKQIHQDATGFYRERIGETERLSYRYDKAGNIIKRMTDAGTLDLTWNADHDLIKTTFNGISTEYKYDPLGRRISKATGEQETHFLWDSDHLIAEFYENEKQPIKEINESEYQNISLDQRLLSREFIHYPDTFIPLSIITTDKNRSRIDYYHNDINGAPTRITDGLGRIVWSANYTPWGGAASLNEIEIENPIRIQGYYEDKETHLFSGRYRYFDTELGGFISQDPIGLIGGINPYQFAPNVIGWIDPLSLSSKGCKNSGKPLRAQNKRGRFAPDFSKPGNTDRWIWGGHTERKARVFARQYSGATIKIGDYKYRNPNGRYQYRAKSDDTMGHVINHPTRERGIPHIHVEKLNPRTGEVIENFHIYWGEILSDDALAKLGL